jgi:hypothetical protein
MALEVGKGVVGVGRAVSELGGSVGATVVVVVVSATAAVERE